MSNAMSNGCGVPPGGIRYLGFGSLRSCHHHHHPCTPLRSLSCRDWANHSSSNVIVELLPDLGSPVLEDRCRGMTGMGLRTLQQVNVMRCPLHDRWWVFSCQC